MAYVASLSLWDIAASLAILERSPMTARHHSGKNLSTQVDNTVFELEADSPRRWKLHAYAVAAPDDETIDFILKNSNLSEL